MAFKNIDQLTLGNIIQIAFSKGVRTQISQDFRDYEMVRRAKVSGSSPREIRFYFQNGLLPSNLQWRDPGTSNRAFPAAFQPQTAEYSAKMKEANASVELEYNLYDRAKKTPEKYAEPLQMILSAAMTSTKREMARALWKDGTGVLAQVGATSASVVAGNRIRFVLDQGDASRGHAGDLEFEEIVVLWLADGTGASALAVETVAPANIPFVYLKVKDKDRTAGTVDCELLNSSFVPVTPVIDAITTQPASGAVFYKYGQPTKPDLTSNATIGDYGTTSEMLAGLESLAANDGRSIHGITMSGVTGSSEKNGGAVDLSLAIFDSALDQAKISVGQDRYKWKMACSAPEVHSKLIEAQETSRRLQTKDDARLGSKVMGIQHRQDFIELNDSEYVHPKRVWIMPETKGGEKVVEYHGSDYETVKAPNGDDFHLKVSEGSYVNSVVSFMQSTCTLIAKHPKSIVKIRNFT